MGPHGLPVGVCNPTGVEHLGGPARAQGGEYRPERFGALRGGGLIGCGLSGIAELHAAGFGGL